MKISDIKVEGHFDDSKSSFTSSALLDHLRRGLGPVRVSPSFAQLARRSEFSSSDPAYIAISVTVS